MSSAQLKWAYKRRSDAVVVTASAQALQGKEIRFVKYVYCVDSMHHSNLKQAARELSSREMGDIDIQYDKQREILDAHWNIANVQIDTDDGTDASLRYCIYQLICHSRLGGGSIPAKGLTGEGYAGHYFWDTEIFIHPFFALTDPQTARQLLLFRYRQLDAARLNARSLGHPSGAAYPWRTITGSECSSFFPGGAAQYHINADIVYALVSYYHITGDETLLLGEGAEILFETARLWMQIGHFCNGSFRIDTVTGPDEYTCLINNSYYTNLLARHNLEWAVRVYHRLSKQQHSDAIERTGLTHEEAEDFRKAYENMYFPLGDEVTPQDDSFLAKKRWDLSKTPQDKYPLLLHYHPMTLYRYQVCKQADVLLAYYLFQKENTQALMKRSYAFYENITTHDSSLSACIFSIMAARLGMTEKAYAYFVRTIRLDLDDIHGNTKDGLHMANLGGSYLSVLGGFAGLMIDGDGVSLAPVLPIKWRSYSFRFIYQSSYFEVEVSADKTKVRRISGPPQRISLDGIVKEY
jgi:alpha,alpha-trehalose phosphorylase